MITFVIQNETHAHNFAPIIELLLEYDIKSDQINTIHLDGLTGLNTASLLSAQKKDILPIFSKTPFYRLKSLSRIIFLLRNSSLIKNSVLNTNVLVVGNDGAIQRLMSRTVRKNGGRTLLLLDGLLHPWPRQGISRLKKILKRNILKLCASLGLDHLAPSDVAHSRLDHIFVMNKYVENLLRDQGIVSRSDVISLPRFANYINDYFLLRNNETQSRFRILYVTGAFLWHNELELDKCQQEDINDITEFASLNPNVDIRIRIHPREEKERYSNRVWPSNVTLTDASQSPLQDIAWASVLLTARSTMALEAQIVGLPVVLYTRNFPLPGPDSFFSQDPYFVFYNNLNAIYANRNTFSMQEQKHPEQSLDKIVQQIKLYSLK